MVKFNSLIEPQNIQSLLRGKLQNELTRLTGHLYTEFVYCCRMRNTISKEETIRFEWSNTLYW